MPGRKFIAGSSTYRYGFNGQEKSTEINGTDNLTTAEYWEYDSRIGRRWNVDPKPDVKLSVYSCFKNNPLSINDINGDTTYHTTKSGKLIDVDNTGGGNWIAAGSYKSSTIKVNIGTSQRPKYEKRTIKIFETTDLYQINDNILDAKQLAGMKIGDQVFIKFNDENINWIMNDAMVKSYSNPVTRWITAFNNSHYKQMYDFASTYLLPALGSDADHKIPFGDTKGGFIIFGKNANRAYNINDAGNWLWGQATMRLGVNTGNAMGAGNIASYLAGDGQDSKEDQFAIYMGSIYRVQTKESIENRIFLSPSVQKNANNPKQKGE